MNSTIKVLTSFLITLAGITVCYTASAIQAFTNIGQGPVGAFQLTASYVTGLKMGLIAILFQGIFFIGQIIIEKSTNASNRIWRFCVKFRTLHITK